MNFSKINLVAMVALLSMQLLISSSAYAGSWTVKYKQYGFTSDLVKGVSKADWPVDVDNPEGVYHTHNYYYSSSDLITCGGVMEGSITPIFTWVPDYEDELPPKVLFYNELSRVLTGYETVHSALDEHKADNGLGDIMKVTGPGTADLTAESATPQTGRIFSVSNPTRSTQIIGPSRKLHASARCDLYEGHQSFFTMSYRAEPIALSIRVRRHGSSNAFSDSAVVAAGAKDNNEHKADIELSTTPQFPGFKFSLPQVVTGDGQVGDKAATVSMNSLVADSSGKATGTYRSNNALSDVYLELATGEEALIDQRWDDTGGLEVPVYFDYDEPADVTFQPAMEDGTNNVPITGHSIKLAVTSVDVWHRDGDDYVLKTYTTDPSLLGVNIEYVPNLDEFVTIINNVNPPSNVVPDSADAVPGFFKVQILVPWDEDDQVESLELSLDDLDVYQFEY